MKKVLAVFPFSFLLFGCYTGSYYQDPSIIKGERFSTINKGIVAVVREGGAETVDIYVDDVKIAHTKQKTINIFQHPIGSHYVIFEIKSGNDSSSVVAYCLDTFQINSGDTTAISFSPILNLSDTSVIDAKISQISKSDFQTKVSSGQYSIRRCSLDSILGCMFGRKYSKLTCEHSSGSRFIKTRIFDYTGLSFTLGFSNGIGDTNPRNITAGKNIGFDIYGMFNSRMGMGIRTAYFGDNFSIERNNLANILVIDPIKLSQMEYTLFLRLFTGKPYRPNVFFEPGIGLISGSATRKIDNSDNYYHSFDTVKYTFNRFCLSGHLGGKIAFFDLRTGFYYCLPGDNGPSLMWYNINMGFTIESKPKFKCD